MVVSFGLIPGDVAGSSGAGQMLPAGVRPQTQGVQFGWGRVAQHLPLRRFIQEPNLLWLDSPSTGDSDMALSIRPMEQRPGTIGVLGTQTLDPSLLCLEPTS